MTVRQCIRLFVIAVLVYSGSALFYAEPGSAQVRNIRSRAGRHAGEFTVPVNKSQILRTGEFTVPVNKSQILRVDVPYGQISVGNSSIADVLPLTDRTIYVLGKKLGRTNLTILRKNKRLIAVVDLVVTYDARGLKAKIAEILPGEAIQVRAVNSSIILSGGVSSSVRLARALAIAKTFAPPNNVQNLVTVRGSQQVMLQVRFAEVSRSVIKQLGIRTAFRDGTVLLTPLDPVVLTRLVAAVFSISTAGGSGLINLVLDALEEKGALKTLAEPTLIVKSGETGHFLAGGEFPVPVSQESGNAITVEFKEFGVSLSFTPTVLDRGLINLVVTPEVSQIDAATSTVTLAGSRIPGLTTRRVSTTVELRDGQSFAIAGLLQNNVRTQVRQLPWLGQIPILGAIFRSTEFQRNETELVVIVTPRLVKPVRAGTLITPADRFIPPSDLQLFLLGNVEGGKAGRRRRTNTRTGHVLRQKQKTLIHLLGRQSAGGIHGPHGHILK